MKILKTLFSAKKIALLLLVAAFSLTLVACKGQSGTPYGSISDNAYLTTNGYTVTEKELYDQLRVSSVSRLVTYIDELVFEDVTINASNLSDFEVSAFEQEINTALFSSATITAKQISSYSDRMISQAILSFADSFAISNPGINKVGLINFLDTVIESVITRANAADFDETADFVFGYVDKTANSTFDAVIDSLIKQYTLAVKKKVYAKQVLGDFENGELTGELADEDSSVYISEANIVTEYRNSIAGKYNVSAVIISFDSVAEGELARYKFAIKSNARGEWFRIPNIADQAIIDQIKSNTDTTGSTPIAKAKDVLANKLGLDIATLTPIAYDSADFATYYSNYSINGIDVALDDSKDNNEVLSVFLEIYDYLNGTNYNPANISDLATGTAFRTDLEKDFTKKFTDIVLSSNTALRSYVYGLDKESMYYETISGPNADGKTYGRPYSRQVQTYNNNQYLVYLLNDERESDKDVLDETDSLDIKFQDNDNAQSQRTKALEKLVKARLTSSYVTTKVNEKYEDIKINIYDPILREFYANTKEYNGSKGFLNNEVLAKVGDKEIKVDDYFAEVTKTLGLSTALDNILMKKLRKDYGAQITDKEMKSYRENLESILKSFQSGGFASNGFPASIGVDKFLLLAVGAYAHDGKSVTEDAIDKMYVQSKLRELFEEDLTAHYGDETVANNIYAKFAELAKKQRDNQIEITADHLLVYVDFNQDGTPDKPTDELIAQQNFDGITTLAEFEEVVAELISILSSRAKQSANLKTGLQTVATAYNNSTRFSKFQTEQEYLDFIAGATPQEIYDFIKHAKDSDVFGVFKRLGLKVKQESLGTISNATNFPGQQSSLDVDFFDYAMALGQHIKTEIIENEIDKPAELLPLFAPDLTASDTQVADAAYSVERTRSSFGWHMILVTGYTTELSAKVEVASGNESTYDSTIANPFVSGKKLSALNDTDDLTWEQILIFIEESKEFEGDVITLPTSVQSAYNKYFAAVKSQYDSSYSQLEIAFNYLFGNSIGTGNASLDAQLTALRQANYNQFFNYSFFSDSVLEDAANASIKHVYEAAINEEYANVYGSWFDVLK
ncbi:hypothetical protein [Acholeplasma hippikon]|uniref:Uncharacterized protein n=1 Tax=Acholeplasma hippikon TaxID=264636 RepID=A0A449BKB9_9MOLU|nr:hypothetical protein [Acholeplasma hippikon]VEU82882.1 Uncharacterised protein [Acholeplasma hippikon]